MIIPERIVIKYMTYCQESGFTPLSRATLLRILSKCAKSVRRSVQGLDYVSAAGAEAFDDLFDVVETLRDVGQAWDGRNSRKIIYAQASGTLKATLRWV